MICHFIKLKEKKMVHSTFTLKEIWLLTIENYIFFLRTGRHWGGNSFHDPWLPLQGKYYRISAVNNIWFLLKPHLQENVRENLKVLFKARRNSKLKHFTLTIWIYHLLHRWVGMITSSLVTASAKSYILLYIQIHAHKICVQIN